jgi:Holliday junction DNA helicase RuvA
MITSIQGLLTDCTPLRAIIELNGFGYEVNIPVTTAEKLPAPGATVKLHTLVIYREDAQTLYGFATPADRDFFRLMIETVSGVGPKLALTIMSRMSLPMLEAAIRDGDVNGLSKCPGIGKKTAERLVVELRAKVGATGSGSPVAGSPAPGARCFVTPCSPWAPSATSRPTPTPPCAAPRWPSAPTPPPKSSSSARSRAEARLWSAAA